MKIRPAVVALYQDNQSVYASLRSRVDELFQPRCLQAKWHYESRVKGEQSFALKIETGRVNDPGQMEDFFACTLVVRNSTEIEQAVSWVLTHCEETHRRPKNAGMAGRPSSFEFDDLRLYVKLRPSPGLPPSEDFKRVFEVQIRTFLFHAWSIATHDLIYKSDTIDWGRARIAFQVRAMLEQAEVAISSAERLATLNQRQDAETRDLQKILDLLKRIWPDDRLPADRKRLAENVLGAARALELAIDDLVTICDKASAASPPGLDLGPYQSIVRWLLAENERSFRRLAGRDRSRFKLVLYKDLEPPDWLRPPVAKNVLLF